MPGNQTPPIRHKQLLALLNRVLVLFGFIEGARAGGLEEGLRHGGEEVGFLGEGKLRRGGRGKSLFAKGHPLFSPSADGEAVENVVMVGGGAGGASGLSRGTVLEETPVTIGSRTLGVSCL